MSALLEVRDLHAGYGASSVLFGVDLTIREGEVATLLGRNGMGKSTLVKCLCGWLRPTAGTISFDGHAVAGAPAHVIGKLGLGLVPEGRQVFPTLSVRENLVATARAPQVSGQTAWTIERVVAFFPRLGERLQQMAGTLSGGEQQMLAIGRALMSRPALLLLDEPSLGLAPLMVEHIFEVIRELKRQGTTMLLVEQNIHHALDVADRAYVMETGRVTLEGPAAELKRNPQVEQSYLGR